jgi:hypothetical protein
MLRIRSFEEFMNFIKDNDIDNCPDKNRVYDVAILFSPKDDVEYLYIVKHCPKTILKKFGVELWDRYDRKWSETKFLYPNKILYILPSTWYDIVPNGIEVVTIKEETIKFERGVTKKNETFDCLGFGFVRTF